MWKKDEDQPVRPTTPPAAGAAGTGAVKAPIARPGHATIGPSIVIKGEVSGSEDLLIEGRVDGSVALDLHSVTVGGGGRVKANISGRVITVEGDVEGDLQAEEQILLRGSANVEGDLRAPRVVLEDGASFRGMVDMGPRHEREREAERRAPADPTGEGPASSQKPTATTKPATGKSPTTSGPASGVAGGGGVPDRKTGS